MQISRFTVLAVFAVLAVLNLVITALAEDDVELTSTLDKETAFDHERVTFTCIARGTGVITWISDEYIGRDGAILQIVSLETAKATVTSNSNPDTIASRVSFTNESVLTSELRVTASVQYQNASITCRNNGNGNEATISFSTFVPADFKEPACTCPTLASIVITPGATTLPDNSSTDNNQACEIGIKSCSAISAIIIAILTAVIIQYIRITYCTCKDSKNMPSCTKGLASKILSV